MPEYTCTPYGQGKVVDSDLILDVKASDSDDAAIAYARRVLPRIPPWNELEVMVAWLERGKLVRRHKVVHVFG
jgi:hypothetical protein